MARSGECGTEIPRSITWRDSRLTENLVAFQGGIGSMRIDVVSLFVCLLGLLVGCLFVWLVVFICLVGWLFGWLVGWLVGQSDLAYDSRSPYCDTEAPQCSLRMRLNCSFPTVSTSFNDIRKL